jgi:hypothetical protein
MPPDADADLPPDGDELPGSKRGIRGRLSEGRRLARLVYRDPEHVAERLTLFRSERHGELALEWASRVQNERPDVPRALIAEEVRKETAQVARIDGAVAGTPFLVALVPGYLAYLSQEGRMERRIAALYGHDPRELETCAQALVLRGVHPTVAAARKALVDVHDPAALPEKPTSRRRLRVWVRSIYVLLVFGGFVSGGQSGERDKYAHWRLKAALGTVLGAAIWVTTWVLPVSFMIAMAWGCESHARSLGSRTLSFYGGESASTEAAIAAGNRHEEGGGTKRGLLRGLLLVLSVAVPIAFIAYADHVRQSTGINWLGALGALVAASLVIATTVIASRR